MRDEGRKRKKKSPKKILRSFTDCLANNAIEEKGQKGKEKGKGGGKKRTAPWSAHRSRPLAETGAKGGRKVLGKGKREHTRRQHHLRPGQEQKEGERRGSPYFLT